MYSYQIIYSSIFPAYCKTGANKTAIGESRYVCPSSDEKRRGSPDGIFTGLRFRGGETAAAIAPAVSSMENLSFS